VLVAAPWALAQRGLAPRGPSIREPGLVSSSRLAKPSERPGTLVSELESAKSFRRPPPPRGALGKRLVRALRREFAPLHFRLVVIDLLVRLLPHIAFPSLRTALYRLAGFSIGKGTLISGRMQLIGAGPIERRLIVGERCYFTTPLFVDLSSPITIGHDVTIGHHVVLVTADHEIGSPWRRAGEVNPKPIAIGDGVWIAARVTVLPGARIGAGAVVGAGSLVKGEIPPGVLAAGVPARVLRTIDDRPSKPESTSANLAPGADERAEEPH